MDQIRVVFLGTSAGLPSKSRNVASVAVVLDGRTILLDCGEGTQQQLLRSSIRMQSIEAIFITHLHGDHCYGLPGLLGTMSLLGRTAPLRLFGPPDFRAYIEGVINTTRLNLQYTVAIDELQGGDEVKFDGFTLRATELEHSRLCLGFAVVEDDRPGTFDRERAHALGVPEGPMFGLLQRGVDVELDGAIIRSSDVVAPPRDGRRIAYCTDTRPCEAAVALARYADLLIHESTYADDMRVEASARAHATSVQAAEIARRAGVARLILTHISPRYEDAAPLVAEARTVFENTIAAEDFLDVAVPKRM